MRGGVGKKLVVVVVMFPRPSGIITVLRTMPMHGSRLVYLEPKRTLERGMGVLLAHRRLRAAGCRLVREHALGEAPPPESCCA